MEQEHFHFIGVAGIGMSGLAKILRRRGKSVSGSDLSQKKILEDLKNLGVCITEDLEIIKKASHVVYSTAISPDHPQMLAAKNKQCQILHRSELLAKLCDKHYTLAVAGSHGKTSSSSLLASVFLESQVPTSFAIGGLLKREGTNAEDAQAEAGKKYFILEADESDGTMLRYHPDALIITNIDSEHLDHYGSRKNLLDRFEQFIQQVKDPQLLFSCAEDPFLQHCPGIHYGFKEHCDLQILSFSQKGLQSSFSFRFENQCFNEVCLNLAGKHNILNAAAVFGLSLKLGIPEESIRKALKEFQGVQRRADLIESINGISLIDDYAHHPNEIKTTLHGFRQAFPERRLVVAFEPHRYTRTRDLMDEFTNVFEDVDELFLTDICPAGQKAIPGIHSKALLQKIGLKNKRYSPKETLKQEILATIDKDDVFVSMGAGSIGSLNQEIHQALKKKCRVACIQGGPSLEHEISLKSAQNFVSCIDKERYEVQNFYISKEGYWSKDQSSSKEKVPAEIIQALQSCDIIVPVLHGPFGEDGSLQGFLQTLGKPFVGCQHRSCSIAMDKALAKHLVKSHGYQTAPFIEIKRFEWQKAPKLILSKIEAELKGVLFVKPSHLGTSFGISRIAQNKDLPQAIEEALELDESIIVEEEVLGRELEFAVLGNEEPLIAGPGEVLKQEGQFYHQKRKQMQHDPKILLRPKLSESLKTAGKDICRAIYSLTQCSGLARIDFFLDQNEQYIFNEINPFPGFTSISLYPKLFEQEGISQKELIEKLFTLAKESFQKNY